MVTLNGKLNLPLHDEVGLENRPYTKAGPFGVLKNDPIHFIAFSADGPLEAFGATMEVP